METRWLAYFEEIGILPLSGRLAVKVLRWHQRAKCQRVSAGRVAVSENLCFGPTPNWAVRIQ